MLKSLERSTYTSSELISGFSIRYPELSRRYSSVLVSVGYGTPPGSNRRRKSVIQKKLRSKFDNHFHVICSGLRLQSPSGKAISEIQKPSLSKRVQNLSFDNELPLHESKKTHFHNNGFTLSLALKQWVGATLDYE